MAATPQARIALAEVAGIMGDMPSSARPPARRLPKSHPTGVRFLDETGSISSDRFFGVGLVALESPPTLLRAIQKVRDQEHWYREFHFTGVTRGTMKTYKKILDLCLGSTDLKFYCFVADRTQADPIVRFGDRWTAYQKMAEQLVLASISSPTVVSVLADNYSTPDEILFEEELKAGVNRRLNRLAVTSVVRLDSKTSDGLQVVDLLTSAAVFEFRAAAGLASLSNDKAELAAYVRAGLGVDSFLGGWRNENHSVQLYDHGRWVDPDGSITSVLP